MPLSVCSARCAKMKMEPCLCSNPFKMLESNCRTIGSWETVWKLIVLSGFHRWWCGKQAVFKMFGSVWFSKFLLPKLQSHSFRREVLTVFNRGRFSLPWPCSSCFTSHFLVLERWLGRKNKTSTNNFFELASSLPAILRVQPNPNVDFTFFGSPLSNPAMQRATHAAQWHKRQVLTGWTGCH